MKRVDELAERAVQANHPMDDENYKKILSLIDDWGIETNWKDVDRILYGSRDTSEV